MFHRAVSVICCSAAIWSPRAVMMWAKAASTMVSPARAHVVRQPLCDFGRGAHGDLL
ncbi:hypothetical protein MHOL44478_17710 [Mycobacterium holsaticum DSM 44478]|nr:hypothetical protein [Mycolicibacterium holsaticum DSM 44478 = JCM 12374]